MALLLGLFFEAVASSALAQAPALEEDEIKTFEDVTVLPPVVVKGAPVEDFGFRLNVTVRIPGTDTVIISEVFPNTASSKAGLKPGDRILKIDGKRPSAVSLGLNPHRLQERKWKELQSGKKSVSMVLDIQSKGSTTSRTVTLVIPSAPPRWGSPKWCAPEGRVPSMVNEAGPLAALARDVLDHGIWSASYGHLGYEWRIVQPAGGHRIWVAQKDGKTEITLEHRSPEIGECSFQTSPSGALGHARCAAPKRKGKRQEYSAEEVRALFQAEVDFWLTKVGRVTGRWPFEALSGKSDVVSSLDRVPRKSAGRQASLDESFRKLTEPTGEQRQLFADAVGKLGLDAEYWAFTETSRSFVDNRMTTVRYDPSKPPDERCRLLKVDGKDPKHAYLKQWQAEGRTVLPGLADLPVLSSLVDVDNLRVYADETAAVVFELPVELVSAEVPPDRFQALFRVNKTSRGFEDFSIKLRESVSVGGGAKLTDAGIEVRFETFDPAMAPQPVFIKMGGGLRVLLVKFSHTYETTRKDFKRVEPYQEGAAALKN